MLRQNLNKVLDEIDEDLKNVLTFLSQFSNEELNKKPAPDVWSVNEIVQHLILSEEQSLNFVKKKVQLHKGPIPKANPTSRLRALVLSTSMKQPIHLKAPEIVTKDFVENTNFKDLKDNWLALRKHMREYLTSIDSAFLYADFYKHPVVGKMDIWGMLNFFSTHLIRHEKQIKKTIRLVEDIPINVVEEQKTIDNSIVMEQLQLQPISLRSN